MQIVLRYFEGCPNWGTARARLDEAIGVAGIDAEVRLEEVTSHEEAERLAFVGSPTILLNGRDPFEVDEGHFGLTCRIYWGEAGASGSPTLRQLVDALRAAES